MKPIHPTHPASTFLNATYDITERDIAVMRYRQLQAEQAVWNITQQNRAKRSTMGKLIVAIGWKDVYR